VTPFIRFRSQPSGNTGSQHDTLRLSCHRCELEGACRERARNTDALPTHFM